MTRIYRYILMHDEGMAPCPESGRMSLATCKPVIRRMARPGDWVIGFRPGSLVRGLVLWAGRVEQCLSHADYQRKYQKRSDAVYTLGDDGAYLRLRDDYHPTQAEMDRDVGSPVLLFEPARSYYFNGVPVVLPDDLAHLAAAGRGHRVNGTKPGDAKRLEAWLMHLNAGPAPRGKRRPRIPNGSCGSMRVQSPCS